jgi:hypothetical protein
MQPGGSVAFEPSDVLLLSTNSPTRDEDPSVIRARDGRLFVAWFSDRGGNADVYLTNTANGREWSAPVRVTTSAEADFYPTLFQDDQGTFHLTWFRWEAFFRGHIRYNRSADGLTWDPDSEVAVTTTANVDDWVPTITQAVDATLLVYFVSEARDAANPTNEIYVARRRPGALNWEPAVPVAAVNSATEHDHLPFVARTGDRITLVWVRHDVTEAIPWLSRKTSLFYSTSSDGLAWSIPARITNDAGNVLHMFPALYPSLQGEWSFLWLSTRSGAPQVLELALANADRYPAAIVANVLPGTGYSHRVAPTTTPGVYLAAWVAGPDGAQDVYYRFFRK